MSGTALAARAARHVPSTRFWDGEQFVVIDWVANTVSVERPDTWDPHWPPQWGDRPTGDETTAWWSGMGNSAWPFRFSPAPWWGRAMNTELGLRVMGYLRQDETARYLRARKAEAA